MIQLYVFIMRFVFQLQVRERVKSVLINVQGGVWENCESKDCISCLLISQPLLPCLWKREKRVCFVQFWGRIKGAHADGRLSHFRLIWRDFPGGSSDKEPTCQCRKSKRREFNPWVGEVPRRRAWQRTLVLLPGESHGQRSLVGRSPHGRRVGHN